MVWELGMLSLLLWLYEVLYQRPQLSSGMLLAMNQLNRAIFLILFLCASAVLTHAQTPYSPMEQAFMLSDRSKANLFSVQLNLSETTQIAGLPDSLLVQENTLHTDIARIERILGTQNAYQDSAARRKLEQTLLSKKTTLERLLLHLKKNHSQYYTLRYMQESPSVAQVQKALNSNTALLSYFVGDSTLFSFLIEPTLGLRVGRVAISQNTLKAKIRMMQSAIEQDNKLVFSSIANELYEILFQLMPSKNIKSLVIVPDRCLGALSFEALLSAAAKPDASYSSMPFLLKKYNVVYALSAALFIENAALIARPDAKVPFMSYAPVFDEATASVMSTQLTAIANELIEQDSISASALFDNGKVQPRRSSEQEAIALAALWQESTPGTLAVLRNDANEKHIKLGVWNDAKILHLTAYSFINETFPSASGLVLAQDTSSNQDGVLLMSEILNLSLKTDLIVLSAHGSSIGQPSFGEAYAGFVRAFGYAGARNVLLSHWQKADAADVLFWQGFYKLVISQSKDNSKGYAAFLQKTKLKFLNDKATSAPYFWAKWALWGR